MHLCVTRRAALGWDGMDECGQLEGLRCLGEDDFPSGCPYLARTRESDILLRGRCPCSKKHVLDMLHSPPCSVVLCTGRGRLLESTASGARHPDALIRARGPALVGSPGRTARGSLKHPSDPVTVIYNP